MSIDNFAVFITTHGRPDNVVTYTSLRKHGYTGPIYLIIDNEDKTGDRYKEVYGDQVVVFDKLKASLTTDVADSIPNRKAVVFARNACFDIAEDLGIEWFLQMDDDYNSFCYRFNKDRQFVNTPISNLNDVLQSFLNYFKSIPAFCIAFAQRGEYIGGAGNRYATSIRTQRKVMNSFFLSTKRRFDFLGRMNDDVNAYLSHGIRGKLMFTIFQISLNQEETQKKDGGMSDIYRDSGTYQKTFYSVMYAPSCASVSMLGTSHRRIHHRITWDNAVPCIVDEKHRKPGRYSEATVNNG